jgi:hypothetical protein
MTTAVAQPTGLTRPPHRYTWPAGIVVEFVLQDVCSVAGPNSAGWAPAVYRRLGAGRLQAEAVLRTYFRDYERFATAPPLRLGPTQAPDGFHEKRFYRVLFAKDLPDHLQT